MAKILTVEEALQEIQSKTNEKGKEVINRFSKKNFNTLLLAMANDLEFKEKVAKVKGGELVDLEEVMVTKDFRKWCQKLVEKAGVDKAESARVLSPEFTIDNVDGLYEFFASAVFQYIDAGNQFDFLPTESFKGGIQRKKVDQKTKRSEAKNPHTGESLGTFEITNKAHKELKVKSSCPAFLKDKKRV